MRDKKTTQHILDEVAIRAALREAFLAIEHAKADPELSNRAIIPLLEVEDAIKSLAKLVVDPNIYINLETGR